MPINIKRKEPEPKELPIEWAETPGAEVGLQVRFMKLSGKSIGVQYNTRRGGGDDLWGIGAPSAQVNMTLSDARELANALLKMADQIEGK